MQRRSSDNKHGAVLDDPVIEKYRRIINEVEDGYAEVDLKGTITFSNEGAAKTWGLQMKGLNYRSYVDEETAKIIFNAYNNVYKTGIPGKLSYEIIRKDGHRRMVEDSVSLMRSPEGKITGFRVISRDITQRMEAEKVMAEHRSRLLAIFESINDAVIMVDPELKIIEANKSTENICGIKIENNTGKTFSLCLSECSKSCCEALTQTVEKRTTIKNYRTECGHQQRPTQIVSITSSPLLDSGGNFMGAVMVIRDITLLQNMERELRNRHQFQNIIGKSDKMQEIYSLLEDLANLDTTILITGESGTGKDLIAKALHYSGPRAFKPFVAVNCSALAESLLESELFGHIKGAFTGAIRDKQGRFQLANHGTILLDEIGDLSPLIQIKLLRVLQEKEFERVGESTPQKADVRVVACTNSNLKEKVKNGEFRQDLYYRLKVVEIALPPLRDRLEDLPLLVDHFCSMFNAQFKKNIEGVSSDVLHLFMNYSWPGNVRELEHALEHCFVLCQEQIITPKHLPMEIKDFSRAGKFSLSGSQESTAVGEKKILDALHKSHWNKTKTAKLLGISRRTLHRKIKSHNLPGK